ncbi:heat-inducible transcriptional repressor HrcA [Desulfovibrio psychrotolerans]|uniref:Heat-inducible transcription repressor HrcA n=1 Tax=Desulfovibrio psychrotolerans TaxID=415242 RepID=A0A7J0BRY5_9BACT|nr:heat-inducible transcriptional repressor HrcA [Desulfovibrio psychrotolerans]GFM35915.1 heat-inducible transcription repressor HrcA [Desulfovibrio psychrotolerans]
MTLAKREADVLSTIIESYIETALPVGSRTVAGASRLRLSAASMRNTMADLTDKGYLEQPHTSAGRIPTAKAFRVYVDSLLRLRPISREEKGEILSRLTQQGLEISQMLQQASAMVSSLSHQVALVLAPGGNDVRWRRVDFALLADKLVLAVLVLDGGIVRNRVVPVEGHVTADELTSFANYLNCHYTGLTLSEARLRILNEMHNAEAHLEQLCSRALLLARLAFSDQQEEERQIFVDGTLTLLDKAEFTDSGRMRELLALLEERSRLLRLLDSTMRGTDVSVSIAPSLAENPGEVDPDQTLFDETGASYGKGRTGISSRHLMAGTAREGERHALPGRLTAYHAAVRPKESGADRELVGLSVISAPYGGDTPLGVVSVIGPLRMDYGTVVPVVDCISKSLSTLLKDRFSA